MTVRRPRTFREYERAVAGFDNLDQGFQRAPIYRFLIDGDDIYFGQEPAQQRHVEQRTTGEEIDGPIARNPGERWVKIALMIHRQNRRPLLNHPLAMKDSKSEK